MNGNQRNYRNALARFATGVSVVVCEGAPGGTAPALGMTVNSFASVSLDPPLTSWCLSKFSRVFKAFSSAELYSINVLAARQQPISERFATPGLHEIESELLEPPAEFRPPRLKDCLAVLECRRAEIFDAGDHIILLGLVESYAEGAEEAPLLYFRSAYHIGPKSDRIQTESEQSE